MIDVGTGNNCYFLPLVVFDPLEVKTIIPPRLYVNEDVLADGLTMHEFQSQLPPGCQMQIDHRGLYQEIPFVEIDCIKSEEDFNLWMKSPLGSCALDEEYWPLYDCVMAEKDATKMTGCTPGYWNYFGTMRFWFENVLVCSVETLDNKGNRLVHHSGSNCPAEIEAILGSEVLLDVTNPDGVKFHAAVMIDTEPTFSVMTQVFSDCIDISKDGKSILRGKPYNAPNRYLSPFRILNENVPLNSSCTFTSGIPVDAIVGGGASPILEFFQKAGLSRNRRLKGVYVSYNLYEVAENRPFNYLEKGDIPNPATSTVTGTVSPWFEDEPLKTHVIARQLNPGMPYSLRKGLVPPVAMLPPVGFHVDTRRKVVALDFLNAIPEHNESLARPGAIPETAKDHKYITADLGKLTLGFTTQDGVEHVIGAFTVDEKELPREAVIRQAGILEFEFGGLGLSDDYVREGSFWIKGTGVNPANGQNVDGAALLAEAQYVISLDQAAVYVDQYSDPSKGVRAFSGKREPCVLRIYEKGRPVVDPIEITVVRYSYRLEKNISCEVTVLGTESYKDGDVFSFSTDRPGGVVYRFIPGKHENIPSTSVFDVLSTSFYMVARVLARKDYSKYLDPTHPEYADEIPWEVIYREIFQTYQLVYPAMARKNLPFSEEVWCNPKMAQALVEAVSYDNWGSAWYMPFTRELSKDQVALIMKWAKPYLAEATKTRELAADEGAKHLLQPGFSRHFPDIHQMH